MQRRVSLQFRHGILVLKVKESSLLGMEKNLISLITFLWENVRSVLNYRFHIFFKCIVKRLYGFLVM